MIEIEQIKQALEKATPAPWMRKDNEIWTVKTDKDDYHTQIVKKTRSTGFENDLNLIANAPTWLASLLTTIESLQTELEGEQNLVAQLTNGSRVEMLGNLIENQGQLIESQKEEIKQLIEQLQFYQEHEGDK